MRRITKDFQAIPQKLQEPATQTLVSTALIERGNHSFKTSVYGHQSVRDRLNEIYFDKCVFCENSTTAGATMQVEHYRPKAKVTGEVHPGYYWLGYDWSNLLLACSRCNNRKRNRFPISGTRVTAHPVAPGGGLDSARSRVDSAELTGESALLVNPEIESRPMRHFDFHFDGSISGRTPEGVETILRCNLDRGALQGERKGIYDWYFNRFLIHFDRRYTRRNISAETLLVLLETDILELYEYSSEIRSKYYEFARACWRRFRSYFINRFQAREAADLEQAYQRARASIAAL